MKGKLLASLLTAITIIAFVFFIRQVPTEGTSKVDPINQVSAIYATQGSAVASSIMGTPLTVANNSTTSISWSVPNVSFCTITKNGLTVATSSAINTVYVTDSSNHRVQKFYSNGTFISKWGSYGSSNGQFVYPQGLAVNPATGYVYVGNGTTTATRIQKFDSSGIFSLNFAPNGTYIPNGIAIDKANNVYAVDASSGSYLYKFDLNGNLTTKFGSFGSAKGQFGWPHGVAIDTTTGNIFVLDTGNNRVQIFDSNMAPIGAWGMKGSAAGQFNSPWGIAIDASPSGQSAISSGGMVYVSDTGNNRVQVFHPNGNYVASFGVPGALNGQFNQPAGLAIDSKGNLYVADLGNNRIQKFDTVLKIGGYIGQWGAKGSGNGQFSYPYGVATLSEVIGNINSGAISTTTKFIITCVGPLGTKTESVTLSVKTPTITSINPNPYSVLTNTTVIIYGVNLTDATRIDFYNASGTKVLSYSSSTPPVFAGGSDTQVAFYFGVLSRSALPPGNYTVRVVTPLGTTNSLPFTTFMPVAPTGTLVKNPAYVDSTASANQSRLNIGSYVFTAGASEKINITTLTLIFSSTTKLTNLSNLIIMINGVQVTSPIMPSASNYFTINFQVPISGVETIDVRADIGSATGTINAVLTVNGVGVTSNVSMTALKAMGQIITIK